MHRYMFLAGALIAALVIGGSGVRSVQSSGTATPAEISVTAEGFVHAPPDTARLWIGVEVFASTLSQADREADQRIATVIVTLRSAGIADPHMRTVGITIAPQYVMQNGQRQELSGYVSQSMLEVETSDIQGVPALIDAAMAAGANRIDQIRFASQAIDQLRSQARDQAWQAARVQAEQLAQRAGTRLDRITSVDAPIVEDTTTIQADQATGYSTGQTASQSSVKAGEIEVRARLHVVWSTQ
jgi:uncharacterized protein YggE